MRSRARRGRTRASLALVLSIAVGVLVALVAVLGPERGGAGAVEAEGRPGARAVPEPAGVSVPVPEREAVQRERDPEPELEAAPAGAEPGGVVAERSRVEPGRPARLVVLVRDAGGRPAANAPVALIEAGASGPPEARPIGRITTDEGRAVLRPRAGVPLTLRVSGRIERQVVLERALAPLAEGEQREVEVELPLLLRELFVRIRDEGGQPVKGATVWFGGDGLGESIPLHRGDTLACGWVECTSLELRVFTGEFAPYNESDVAVPADGRPVDVVLRRGHELRVEVLDARGERVAGGQLHASYADANLVARAVGPGEFELDRLPDCELKLVLQLAGAEYERSAASSIGRLELRVPDHGALEVGWGSAREENTERRLVLAARAAGPEPQTITLAGDQGVARFEPLLPGAYRVQLQQRPREGEWETLAAEDVDVRARETADAVLGT